MKIVKNTPDELILENKPWAMGIIVIVALLAAIFVAMNVMGQGNVVAGLVILLIAGAICLVLIWAFVRLEEVRFSRPDGAVQVRVRSIGGKSLTEIPLATVQGAMIETSTVRVQEEKPGKRGKSTRITTTYRPSLRMIDQNAAAMPLVVAYNSNDKPAREAVTAINLWIAQRPA